MRSFYLVKLRSSVDLVFLLIGVYMSLCLG